MNKPLRKQAYTTALAAEALSGSLLAWVTTGWVLTIAVLIARPLSLVSLSIALLAIAEAWTTYCWRENALEWERAYSRDIGELRQSQARLLESQYRPRSNSFCAAQIQTGFPLCGDWPYPIDRHEPSELSPYQNTPDIRAVCVGTYALTSLSLFQQPFDEIPRSPRGHFSGSGFEFPYRTDHNTNRMVLVGFGYGDADYGAGG